MADLNVLECIGIELRVVAGYDGTWTCMVCSEKDPSYNGKHQSSLVSQEHAALVGMSAQLVRDKNIEHVC